MQNWKRLLPVVAAAILLLPQLSAQNTNCQSTSAVGHLDNLRLKAAISNTGTLFRDASGAALMVSTDTSGGVLEAATLYSSSLWFVAQGDQGQIALIAPTYNWLQNGFSAGPLDPATGQSDLAVCTNFDRLWSVSAEDIADHLIDWADNGVIDQPVEAIMAWPGRNNPHFEPYNGFPLPYADIAMAPFFDNNGDGIYNPLDGDYPDVELAENPPSQLIWCIYSRADVGLQLGQTAWVYSCTGNSPLNRTVFVRFDLTYLGATELTDAYVGLWSDPDLGCYTDDFIGSYPAANACFVYNSDDVDGITDCSCLGNVPAFCDQIPVQSMVLLNNDMSSFIAYNSPSVGENTPAITDPNSTAEYYNYLRGHWRDGSPITVGGNGYQSAGSLTSFLYDGDPRNPNEWTMMQPSSSIQNLDSRTLMNTSLGALSPGRHIRLDYAYAYHLHPNPSYWLDHIGQMYEEVDWLRSWYAGLTPPCDPPQAVSVSEPISKGVYVYPNPTSGQLNVRFEEPAARTLRVFDLNGRICNVAIAGNGDHFEMDSSALPAGLYILQVTSAGHRPQMMRWLKQ